MSDYQQIPGSIRSLLATRVQTWTDHTTNLATQYAMLCDETNQRLRRCAEYLRRGMGSAATHLADCQPNLLQAVIWLQFPERAAWADLCVSNGMPAPAVLESECLDELKAAYERGKKLEPLLSRHRLLAIARAPVADRLEIARQLAAAEPGNPVWDQETPALESVRLGEIAAKTHVAIHEQDEAAIQSLWAEITGNTWRQHIPQELHATLERANAKLRVDQRLAALPALAAEMEASFASDPSSQETAGLLMRWKELTAIPGLIVPGELKARVQPILDWQEAQIRRKNELEEVKPFQHLFAPAQTEVTASPRRWRSMLIGGGLAILGVLGGIAYYYFHILHKRPLPRFR